MSLISNDSIYDGPLESPEVNSINLTQKIFDVDYDAKIRSGLSQLRSRENKLLKTIAHKKVNLEAEICEVCEYLSWVGSKRHKSAKAVSADGSE